MKNINLRTSKLGMYLICAAIISFTGCREEDPQVETLTQQDRDFARDAGHGMAAGIQSGELAGGNQGQNADVATFGQGIVTNQTAAQGRLSDLGAQHQFDVPMEANQQDTDNYNQLMGFQGHQFDSAYLQQQITAGQNSINLYQNHMNTGTHPGLRDWAAESLPGLEADLARAQELQGQLGGGAPGGTPGTQP